ncbi:uncharacterized protein LY79DRAFT_671742 [Colletotrichum navitas]|uniref:Major facilitator superfamily transporter n=1 Tax=Colletotrichum navitas TaxID=681940 RepID=A0AAD8V218_9PEZI|nr:uncharacterized protein LY79DRAFT_671742 [Colletotrichum navitas]KAK1580506.1 hypothetical protein LY79DRAFT_671742 [Colletotrichum navitas]
MKSKNDALLFYVLVTHGGHLVYQELAAFLFPLFAPGLHRALGHGCANSVMAPAGVITSVPLPVFLWKCGAR